MDGPLDRKRQLNHSWRQASPFPARRKPISVWHSCFALRRDEAGQVFKLSDPGVEAGAFGANFAKPDCFGDQRSVDTFFVS